MCQGQGWDILAEAISPCYAMNNNANPNPSVGCIPSSLGPGEVLLLTAHRRLGGGCCRDRSRPWTWRHTAVPGGEEI